MRKLLSLLFCLFLVLGCVSSPDTRVVYVPSGTDTSVATTITFHADTSFTPEERVYIARAAKIWRDGTDGLADIRVVYDYNPASAIDIRKYGWDPIMLKRPGDSPAVRAEDLSQCPFGIPCILGWCNQWGGVHAHYDGELQLNLIPSRYGSGDMFVKIAAHEMGHILGLQHTEHDPYALMFNSNSKDSPDHLTQPDISEFCRVNQCGNRGLGEKKK